MHIPEKLSSNVINIWGALGVAWLNQLEDIVHGLCRDWALTDLCVIEEVQFHFLARAHQEHYGNVVLKIGIDRPLVFEEQRVLELYNGNASVKLLASDNARGALLLESLEPGISLKSLFPLEEERACEIFISVISGLHTKPLRTEDDFMTVEEWVGFLYDFKSEHIPNKVLKKAQELARFLCQTQADLFLLHGDLHHENILESARGWLVIDPKGVIGERAFEIGPFMRNPYPDLLEQHDRAEIIKRRLDLFSNALGIEKTRIAQWSYVQAVLAACWALDDNIDNWRYFLTCAELIEKVNTLD
jgi:streptomycin 6-kinase